MTIHWCGTGLSSVPGLRRLIGAGHKVVVWNRTVEKAREAVGDLTSDIRAYDLTALAAALQPGDVAISMLPADQHVGIAKVCLDKGANFVSSSYIAPEMRALDAAFKAQGLASVNEVGLDPGIDHLMAHDLVARYRASDAFDPENVLSFTSYCGGVPKIPNPFRYKFSWAPLGVLKALRSPCHAAVVADRLALLGRVAAAPDATTALGLLAEAGVGYYLALSGLPDWDKAGEKAAFLTDGMAVYITKTPVRDAAFWAMCNRQQE